VRRLRLRPEQGDALRSQPQSAVDRSRLRFRLATKLAASSAFARMQLQTIVATASRRSLHLSKSGFPTAL
jgi:hypothetical protein